VLVKSDGREDALVIVDPRSPDEIQVSMAEKHKPKHNRTASPKPDPRPDPTPTIEVPPNPYD
jgi:hypothetical protein